MAAPAMDVSSRTISHSFDEPMSVIRFRNGKRAVLFRLKYFRTRFMYQDAPYIIEKRVSINIIENNKTGTADVIDFVAKED
jgi:hypothetical protein